MKKSILLIGALMFVLTISNAQTIPNAGFENWTNTGTYNNPDGWGQLNSTTASMSIYTCEKGTPGSVGNAYLKLTSKAISGMGVVPGICVSGKINQTTLKPESGFAFNMRPTNLTGKWQHMIYGSSQGFIQITFTRWDAGTNKQISVGSGKVTLSGMAMSWANFSIPITYSDVSNPDSCVILMSASGTNPTDKDYLWIDGLSFTGTTSINNIDKSNVKLNIFPNPSSEDITVDLTQLIDKNVSIKIFDIQGKLLKTMQNSNNTSEVMFNISDLQKGNYILNILTNEGIVNKKIIKE